MFALNKLRNFDWLKGQCLNKRIFASCIVSNGTFEVKWVLLCYVRQQEQNIIESNFHSDYVPLFVFNSLFENVCFMDIIDHSRFLILNMISMYLSVLKCYDQTAGTKHN